MPSGDLGDFARWLDDVVEPQLDELVVEAHRGLHVSVRELAEAGTPVASGHLRNSWKSVRGGTVSDSAEAALAGLRPEESSSVVNTAAYAAVVEQGSSSRTVKRPGKGKLRPHKRGRNLGPQPAAHMAKKAVRAARARVRRSLSDVV